jgi:hypothetical protein
MDGIAGVDLQRLSQRLLSVHVSWPRLPCRGSGPGAFPSPLVGEGALAIAVRRTASLRSPLGKEENATLQQIGRDQRPRRFGRVVACALQHVVPFFHVDPFEQTLLEDHATDVICAAAGAGDATPVEGRRGNEPRRAQADWTLHVSPKGCPAPNLLCA